MEFRLLLHLQPVFCLPLHCTLPLEHRRTSSILQNNEAALFQLQPETPYRLLLKCVPVAIGAKSPGVRFAANEKMAALSEELLIPPAVNVSPFTEYLQSAHSTRFILTGYDLEWPALKISRFPPVVLQSSGW
jgi:hypothetical protein